VIRQIGEPDDCPQLTISVAAFQAVKYKQREKGFLSGFITGIVLGIAVAFIRLILKL
jgi:hypothetical protein